MAAVTKVQSPSSHDKFHQTNEAKQGYSLKLQPQSGRRLQPREQAGVRQVIHLNGVEQGRGDSVKLRWKASYKIGEKPVNEQGEIASLGVA